jgi:hypothetical protein
MGKLTETRLPGRIDRRLVSMETENRTLEHIYRSAVKGLYARLRSYYDYLYEKFGDEGIEMIADMSRQYGLTIIPRAQEALEDNDIKSVGSYLVRIFRTVEHGRNTIEIVEEGDKKIIVKAKACPLHFDNPAMCLAHTTMEKTVMEGLNPDLYYHIGKSIPAGDEYCEHILEVREGGNER